MKIIQGDCLDKLKELRVSNMTIYRYIEAGRLIAYKIGGEYRIDKKDYNNFLNKVKTK